MSRNEKSEVSDAPKRLEASGDLYVVELDERLEFGAAIIDSDLQADDNSGCVNKSNCSGTPNSTCTNDLCSNKGSNNTCNNDSCV